MNEYDSEAPNLSDISVLADAVTPVVAVSLLTLAAIDFAVSVPAFVAIVALPNEPSTLIVPSVTFEVAITATASFSTRLSP